MLMQRKSAAGQQQDIKEMKRMRDALAKKKGLQKLFSTGVKKAFLQWVMHMMEVGAHPEHRTSASSANELASTHSRACAITFKSLRHDI